MNKGFTLVELLAVLFILSVITIVAVPNVITTNQKSKEKDIAEFKKTVENAAEVYVETHLDTDWVVNLKKNGNPHCININDLIVDKVTGAGVNLLNPNLKNPENDTVISSLNASVFVKKIGDEIVYEYKDTINCT